MKLFLFAVAAVISFNAVAAQVLNIHNQPQLKMLSNAWHTSQHVQPLKITDDITIVYGGADVSQRPSIVLHKVAV